MAKVAVSASFTRPADTTAYTSGDLVANSTTAASVVPLRLAIGHGGGKISQVSISNNRTVITNGTFTIHFYGTDPTATAPTAGDNGALATVNASRIGVATMTIMTADNDIGMSTLNLGETNFLGGLYTERDQIFALVEAKAAYTPASGEVFTVKIVVEK